MKTAHAESERQTVPVPDIPGKIMIDEETGLVVYLATKKKGRLDESKLVPLGRVVDKNCDHMRPNKDYYKYLISRESINEKIAAYEKIIKENEDLMSKLKAENHMCSENIKAAKILLMAFEENGDVIERRRTYKKRTK